MKSDSQIVHETKLPPIVEIGAKINIPQETLKSYGKCMAKVPYTLISEEEVEKANLIMVTFIAPTRTGNSKAAVSAGFTPGMNRLGKETVVTLREPSLGSCFGIEGRAAGGGYAQVLSVEKISLRFAGDFHIITLINNMISALLNNYCCQNQDQGFALKEALWRRTLDVNDRDLHNVITGLGHRIDGIVDELGFNIVSASGIIAILCLAKDEGDLQHRIGNILLGLTFGDKPFIAKDSGVTGAVTTLLHDAIRPNLVQTIEHTPTFIYGGPFANVVHGCSSVMVTKMGTTFGDYIITEAGPGVDLDAERFLDIKCRKVGLSSKLTVLMVAAQAPKLRGDTGVAGIKQPYLDDIHRGLTNIDKHIANMQAFGQNVVMCTNRSPDGADEELALIQERCQESGAGCAVSMVYIDGGEGAEALAQLAIDTIDEYPSAPLKLLYSDGESIEEKVRKVAQHVYDADDIAIKPVVEKKPAHIATLDYTHFSACITKTQYSFPKDAKTCSVPTRFKATIHDFVIGTGAEMIMAIAGNIIRMPGLPKSPQAERLCVRNGMIQGLS